MSYEKRMGRYSGPLGGAFLDLLDLPEGARVLDVGCGSGALTEHLVARLGGDRVFGIDPAGQDLRTCAERAPGADLREGRAEQLPWADDEMDAVLAQLVMGLVNDAAVVVAEMRRVCRPGGVVAGSVWDFGGGMTMLRAFWEAAREVDPEAERFDQARSQNYTREGELGRLWGQCGLNEVRTGPLVVEAEYTDTDDLWLPLVATDGTPGRYLAQLAEPDREKVRRGLLERLGSPTGPFRLTARAWYASGTK